MAGQQCTPARNNRIGLWLFFLLFFGSRAMIKSNGWGHSYCATWTGILGPVQDELKQKHLPRIFSLIKNKSWRLVANSLSSGVTPITHQAACRTPKFSGSGGRLVIRALPGVESETKFDSTWENLPVPIAWRNISFFLISWVVVHGHS